MKRKNYKTRKDLIEENEILRAKLKHYENIQDMNFTVHPVMEFIFGKDERLQKILELIPDAVTIADSEGVILTCNQSASKLLGYRSSDIIGHRLTDFMTESSTALFEESFSKLSSVASLELELQFRTCDGRIIDIWRKGIALMDSTDTFIGILVFDREITKMQEFKKMLKEKTEELKRQADEQNRKLREMNINYQSMNKMFRLMADNVPDLIWAKDLNKRFIFVNKAMCEILLKAKDVNEPIGKTDLYFAQREQKSHPERDDWHTFGQICVDSDNVVLKHQKAMRFDEFGNVRGKFLFLDVHKAPFFDQNGNIIGTVGCGRDVTQERKLLAEKERHLVAIKQSLELFLTAFDEIPYHDFLSIIGPASEVSRVYIYLSRGPEARYTFSRVAEWCAEGKPEHISDGRYQDISLAAILPRESDCRISPYFGKPSLSHRFRPLISSDAKISSVIPIKIDAECIGFLCFDNCDASRKWENIEKTFMLNSATILSHSIKRIRMEELVTQSLEEKKALLQEVHHRVKNNLQIIISLLELQLRHIDTPETREIFHECQVRISAMALVHEILYRSKNYSHIDFQQYMEHLIFNLMQAYGRQMENQQVNYNIDKIFLSIDQAIAIGLVVSELITNSIKHAFPDNRGGSIAVTMNKDARGEIHLVIEDDGIGLPQNFDLNINGALGLSLVRTTIENQLGGKFDIDGKDGTRVTIRFKPKPGNNKNEKNQSYDC